MKTMKNMLKIAIGLLLLILSIILLQKGHGFEFAVLSATGSWLIFN